MSECTGTRVTDAQRRSTSGLVVWGMGCVGGVCVCVCGGGRGGHHRAWMCCHPIDFSGVPQPAGRPAVSPTTRRETAVDGDGRALRLESAPGWSAWWSESGRSLTDNDDLNLRERRRRRRRQHGGGGGGGRPGRVRAAGAHSAVRGGGWVIKTWIKRVLLGAGRARRGASAAGTIAVDLLFFFLK